MLIPLAPYRININLVSGKRFKKPIFKRICEQMEKIALIGSYLITAATAGFFIGMTISAAPIPVGICVALILSLNRFV